MSNVFDKIGALKKVVRATFGDLSDKDILVSVDHICRYKEGVRKHLSLKERALMDFILREGFNCKTVVCWLRVLKLPRFIKDQIRNENLSVTAARRIYRDYKIKTDSKIEEEIQVEIRRYFRSMNLQEFIDEGMDNVRRKI